MSDNTEALANALRNHRDEEIARLFVLVFGIAAERHPELLRTTLSHVLDTKVIEETQKKLMGRIERQHEIMQRQSREINQLHLRLSKAGQIVKELEARLENHKRAVAGYVSPEGQVRIVPPASANGHQTRPAPSNVERGGTG